VGNVGNCVTQKKVKKYKNSIGKVSSTVTGGWFGVGVSVVLFGVFKILPMVDSG